MNSTKLLVNGLCACVVIASLGSLVARALDTRDSKRNAEIVQLKEQLAASRAALKDAFTYGAVSAVKEVSLRLAAQRTWNEVELQQWLNTQYSEFIAEHEGRFTTNNQIKP